MAIYKVEVLERLSRVVEQEADTYEEAEEIVSEQYDREKIVLDYTNFDETIYKPNPPQKLKDNFSILIEYDKQNEKLYITRDFTSRENHKCEDISDLERITKEYYENNINLEDIECEKEMER